MPVRFVCSKEPATFAKRSCGRVASNMDSHAISCSTRVSTIRGAVSARDSRSRRRKSWRLLDLFRLPQMAAIVRRNDEETGGDAESDEREERILEPRAVRVDDRRVADQLTSEIVSGVIVVQYRLSVLRWSWFCLAWRAQAASDRRLHRLDELPAEITGPCRFPAA